MLVSLENCNFLSNQGTRFQNIFTVIIKHQSGNVGNSLFLKIGKKIFWRCVLPTANIHDNDPKIFLILTNWLKIIIKNFLNKSYSCLNSTSVIKICTNSISLLFFIFWIIFNFCPDFCCAKPLLAFASYFMARKIVNGPNRT